MTLKIQSEKYYTDEPFLIRRNLCGNTMVEPKHTHDFLEIIYVYNGECEQFTDNRKYLVSKGDLLFVNYGSTHSFAAKRGFEYVNIIIKPEYVHRSLSGTENAFALLSLADYYEFAEIVNTSRCFMSFSEEEQKTLERLIELMEKERSNKSPGSEVILHSAINIVLTLVFRKMALPICERMYLNAELLEYIRNNCNEALSMKKIAARCFYNPSYFSRAFKQYTGETFVSYVTNCRIAMACELLMHSESKIDVIMEKCGFTDRTRFFRVFTEKMGVSPLQYRKSKK